jgi:serine/threonine-protein kinase BUR1
MVFPYMEHDLCGLLLNKDFRMTHSIAKLLLKQILEGLSYMHSNSIIHRDLKTANILVGKDGTAMIADFGLARTLGVEEMPRHSPHEYTNMVVTRWYRAPELLLGDTRYTTAVDLWSIGCILGEMYLREPIFAGSSDRDQLVQIFRRAGAPCEAVWPGWRKLPGFPDAKDHPWDMTTQEQSMLQSARKWQ